ncbi:hypothetical protein ABZ499_12415 [Streptomyces sp. NPDC019990]|uniref:hypothetical protein n=1 Tax=Streptomyces sp. NPDC019990 TaxID=3154693 RepID=UPI0033F85E72
MALRASAPPDDDGRRFETRLGSRGPPRLQRHEHAFPARSASGRRLPIRVVHGRAPPTPGPRAVPLEVTAARQASVAIPGPGLDR